MKIAIASTGNQFDSVIEKRFARCTCFIFLDTDNGGIEFLPNPYKDVDFEVGKDAVRNPLKNYMHKTPKYGTKTLATFKFTKVISSILLANAVIGFVVPKINQAITNNYQKSVEWNNEDNRRFYSTFIRH